MVEGARLESAYTCQRGIEGSNPSLSAMASLAAQPPDKVRWRAAELARAELRRILSCARRARARP